MHKRIIILTAATFVLIFAGIRIYMKYFRTVEIPAGGPCSYEEEYFPARIIGLDVIANDSTQIDLAFEIQYDGLFDTLSYSETNETYYNAKTGGLVPDTGLVVKYVHKYIVEGSCSPDFFYIEMLPYKGRN